MQQDRPWLKDAQSPVRKSDKNNHCDTESENIQLENTSERVPALERRSGRLEVILKNE